MNTRDRSPLHGGVLLISLLILKEYELSRSKIVLDFGPGPSPAASLLAPGAPCLRRCALLRQSCFAHFSNNPLR